jgi:peptidoglycan/xylan/chitin deacetylase (PgdA/CDA1 family)
MVRSALGLLWAVSLAILLSLPGGSARAQVWDEVAQGDPSSDMVALTFDAGSVDGPAAEILATLRNYNLHLTFFLTGHWVESYPELALEVATDGHELANHSYFHPDLTGLGNQQIAWELEYTNALIEARLGRDSKPWFRPPFGARNQRVLDLAGELGYRSVYWTLDSGDWRNNATAPVVLNRVLSNIGPGDIVVHHVAAIPTAEALPAIIEGIQARGLRIVTVSELLGLPPTRAAR